jgi:hypothetical protein
MYYIHGLQFPFTNTVLNFKELNCYQSYSIIKINNSIPPNSENRLDYHLLLLEILNDTVKEKDKLLNLNLIEFLMFCIRLRTLSISSFVELSVEDENEKNKKITINFYDLMKNIYDYGKIIEKYKDINNGDVTVSLCWPSLKAEEFFLSNIDKDYFIKFVNSLPLFVETIKIKDDVFNFNSYDIEQKMLLMESLPVSIKNIIQTNVLSLIQETSTISLFNISTFDDYKLEFFNGSIQDIIRFLFAGTDESQMMEIVFLKRAGFLVEEIYKMTPLEKNNYISYIHSQNEASNT